MRVSKFSDMIPAVVTLAVFTGALVLFPGKGLFVYPVPAYIVFALCECMALLNVWALGKYYVLTDQASSTSSSAFATARRSGTRSAM